jgi:hypothetical protein
MKLPTLTSENVSQLCQIADTTKCNLEALKATKQNTDRWDMIIIYTLVQKLDNKTKKEWELHISNKELSTSHQLYTFLEHRCNALESVSTKPKTYEQRQSSERKMSHSYEVLSQCVKFAKIHLFYLNAVHLNNRQIMKNTR